MTAGHGNKRPQCEDRALAALLSEPTMAGAAKQAGISESTLLRWLDDPAFQARYRAARRQVLDQAVSGLQQAAGKAVTVLVAIAEDASAPPAARVSAAKTIIDQGFRGLELTDLAARIEQLERGPHGGELA
jgi:hypothetical protein